MIAIMSFNNLLRVPLIFIIDELFKRSFGLQDLEDIMFPVNTTQNKIEIWESVEYGKAFIKIIVSCLMFCSSLCLLILPARDLFPVYRLVVSVCVVLVSCWANMEILGFLSEKYKDSEIDTTNGLIKWDIDYGYIIIMIIQLYPRLYKLFYSIILQYCLSLAFDILQVFTTNHSIHKVFRYSFIIPTLIASFPNTSRILKTGIMLSTLLQLIILVKILLLNIFTIAKLIQRRYNRAQEIINNYGIDALVEREWIRLKIPSVLRMFWAIRVLIQVLYLSTNMTEIKNLTLFETVKYLLIKGCDTCTAVLGMTSFLSYFCDNIGAFFQWVLLIDEVDDLKCAVIFIVLTIQSGLSGLDPEVRLKILYENVHLVFIYLQGYINIMVHKLLMHFNAPYNYSLNRHLRPLLVCVFLIVLAVTSFYLILSYHSVSPWLLAVTVLYIVSITQVLLSLAVYALLLINSNRSTSWEDIDDYVYYIELFGKILNFCFCIFLFLNDVYIMVYISGGIFRGIVICTQAYVNACNARIECRLFIKRCTAVKKVGSLPDATSVQLTEFDDVCAICFQKMRSAKITKCNHYFHSVCLRKWTYLRDNCPLCQSI